MKTPNLNNFAHILFDYDGLLVDSEKLYFETWCLVLTDQGKEVCREFHEGKHESEVYEEVKPYLVKPMTLEEVSKYRKLMFDHLITKGRLELKNGIRELLERLKGTIPMSIVSNSTIDVVLTGLESTRLEGYFDKLFCYSANFKRKPAPDLYNAALSELKISKETVIALEDSKSGILSAKAAGIQVICINSDNMITQFCEENNVLRLESAFNLLSF